MIKVARLKYSEIWLWECICGRQYTSREEPVCGCVKKPVMTKEDFAYRYKQGEFGNGSPTWSSLQAFRSWSADQPMSDLEVSRYNIRSTVAGSVTLYDLTWLDTLLQGERLMGEKRPFYISEMCPTHKTVFQGEVRQTGEWDTMNGRCGLDLFYSTVKKPMKEALAESSKAVSGIIATLTLQYYMDLRSYEWLMYLLEQYPFHVVEFTTLSQEWGTVPGYRTLFWEVRGNY